MKALLEKLKEPFEDKEYRSAYAASFMNSYVAAQIKTLREQRSLTQQALAELVGTKQAGISRLENVNYSAWKVETLAKLAEAFDVRLKISFEEFGSLPLEVESFNRSNLERAEFKDDVIFHPPVPVSVLTSPKLTIDYLNVRWAESNIHAVYYVEGELLTPSFHAAPLLRVDPTKHYEPYTFPPIPNLLEVHA